MQRVCFQLQVRPERIEEYVERHRSVWPDMLKALAENGWHNYSLFLRPDGLLIGYLETPSLEEAQQGMAATEVNARWQKEMAEFFVELGDDRPDTGFVQLEEVFHLEDQLAALDSGQGGFEARFARTLRDGLVPRPPQGTASTSDGAASASTTDETR